MTASKSERQKIRNLVNAAERKMLGIGEDRMPAHLRLTTRSKAKLLDEFGALVREAGVSV